MFRTDINRWLQQFDSPFFHWFFEGVSAIGTVAVLTLILYSVIMGVDFKKGFGVVNIFFYVILITLLCKHTIDYPRPMAVDGTLNSFDRPRGQNLADIQPKGNFELFSDKLLKKIRTKDIAREGFPSGHTSLITSLLIGSALVFRRRWLWYLGAMMIPLMMLSRMYLARHYPGDVLGGLTIGIVFSFIVYYIWKIASNSPQNSTTQLVFYLSPLIFLAVAPWVRAFPVGTFIGLNAGYIMLVRGWGMPQLPDNWQQRLLSIFTFAFSAFLTTYASQKLGLERYSALSIIIFTGLALASFLAAAYVCIRLKWWSKQTPVTPVG